MTSFYCSSSVLTVLVILISRFSFSTTDSIAALGDGNNHHGEDLPRLPALENMEGRLEQKQEVLERQEKEGQELFKDVDPKRLAAVLLEALNDYHPQQERGTHDEERNRIEEDGENVKEEEAYGQRADRDGRQELEMWMALNGKERERDQEEERRKALEEEEKITEKVTSHTSSRVVQIETEPKQSGPNETAESGTASQQETSSPEQGRNQEEEQLNSKELKSLENVMKEFPRLNTKRGDDSEQQLRESRAFSSYNDIRPGPGLALSKKKLKWQEETQKALHFPTFKEYSHVDKSTDNSYINKTAQSMSPAEQEVTAEDGSEEAEEALSPEEEEAQARVEQEEMIRQAAEAQRAKTKEEELADIASDMLLRYVVKQNNMNWKYGSSMFYAAEDKRSNEELDITEDDLDPQTIDKLIEISSKLHLPADDVVDIITDVEKKKKKKKDMLSEIASPLRTSPSSFLSAWQILNNKNSFPASKQPSPAKDLSKIWFQEMKPDGFQTKSSKSSLANQSFLMKPEKLFKQDHWIKSPKSLWAAYPYRSFTYPSYYHRKPFSDNYPFSIPPLPRPKHYYMSNPALALNNYPGTSTGDLSPLSPKRRYRSRVQLQSPHSHLQQKSYSRYHPPVYPLQFQQYFIPKVKPPSQTGPSPSQLYTSGLGPTGTKKQNYLETGKSNRIIHGDLEKYIQQTLMNRQRTQG